MKLKTALVLGGGGARGLAHLGVLKILEEKGFRPNLIVGCSIGAIIGGMYARHPDIRQVTDRIKSFFESDIYSNLKIGILERQMSGKDGDLIRQITGNLKRRMMLNYIASRQSILKDDKVDPVINFLIDDEDFRKTKIPFACNATNLVTGQPVYFTTGKLRFAIRASSSIPGYLAPAISDSKILVDGAVTGAIPARFARQLGAELVIAVNVKQKLKAETEYTNVFDILFRANSITSNLLNLQTESEADIMIEPDVGDHLWYDFSRMDDIISAGEEAGREAWPVIRKQMKKSGKKFWSRFIK